MELSAVLLLLLLLTQYPGVSSRNCPLPPDVTGTLKGFPITVYGTSVPRYTSLEPGSEVLYHCWWYGWAFLTTWDVDRVTGRLRCGTDGQWMDIETGEIVSVDVVDLCAPVDITLNRRALQSSTLNASFGAANAIYRTTDPEPDWVHQDMELTRLARTKVEWNPWWVVDLGETFLVFEVKVYHPIEPDTAWDYMADISMGLLESFDPSNPSLRSTDFKRCGYIDQKTGLNVFDCRNVHVYGTRIWNYGRFVALNLVGHLQSLVLTDVSVTGAAWNVNITRWCNMCKSGSMCVTSLKRTSCECVLGALRDYWIECERSFDECSADYVDTFYCKCLSGYTGVYCETDIDECQSDPCQNGGSCSDIDNGYRCKCTEGHFGVSCEAKLSKASEVSITGNVSGLSEKDELKLYCEARGGQPNMYTYAWHFKAKYEGNERMIKGQELRLSTLKYNDSGSYECQATNEAGTSIKAEWVDVRHSPKIFDTQQEVFFGKINEEVTIGVKFYAHPNLTSQSWTQPSELTNYTESLMEIKPGEYSANITGIPTMEVNFGIYKYMLENSVGKAEANVKLLKAKDEDATISIVISRTTAFSMWLTWEPRLLQEPYMIFYRLSGLIGWRIKKEGISQPNDSEKMTVKVDGLKPNTSYDLQIEFQHTKSSIFTVKTRALPLVPGEISFNESGKEVQASWEMFQGDFDHAAIRYCRVGMHLCGVKDLKHDTTSVNMTLIGGTEYLFSLQLFQDDLCVVSSKEQPYVTTYTVEKKITRYKISKKGEEKVFQAIGLIGVIVAVVAVVVIVTVVRRPQKSEDKVDLVSVAGENDQGKEKGKVQGNAKKIAKSKKQKGREQKDDVIDVKELQKGREQKDDVIDVKELQKGRELKGDVIDVKELQLAV